jgi:hypothetical protein
MAIRRDSPLFHTIQKTAEEEFARVYPGRGAMSDYRAEPVALSHEK